MSIKTVAISTLHVPLLATLLFAGAVQAQTSDPPDSAQTSDLPDPWLLPDHPLYFVTSMSEGVGTFFTFGDANEAERALELSEKRLAEAHALAAQGKPEAAERAVERYQAQLDRALTEAEEAREKGEDPDEILTQVSEKTLKHQAVLADVYERVPEQARPAIERAMQASKRGHAQAGKARDSSRGRPDSPGRANPRGEGPPDSVETGRPDSSGRANPRGQGPPDSVETGPPDTAGGR